MPRRFRELRSRRGEVHFSWTRRTDGAWEPETVWGRTTRSGRAVEKDLSHLVARRFETEDACVQALERAARAWLHEHR